MPDFYNMEPVNEGSAKIYIQGDIGMSWWDENSTDSASFVRDLDALGDVDNIELHINSKGGNVYEGVAIYNHLKAHDAKVKVVVDGIAASIASVIAMAGDEIVMPLGATMFVHDPATWVGGTADEMRDMADHLDKVKNSIIDIYADKSGMNREEIATLMSDETTMTAAEAVEWGFATATDEPEQPIINSFDRDALKGQVMMSAKMQSKDREITNLKEQLQASNEGLQAANGELTILKAVPVAADASDIVAQCKAVGLESMTANFIENKSTSESVKTSLENAVAIRDICAASHIEHVEVMASMGDSVEMVRHALNAKAVSDEDQIDSSNSPDALASDAGTKTSVVNIYAKRKLA